MNDDLHGRGPIGWAVALRVFYPEVAEFLIDNGGKLDIFSAIALDNADVVRDLVNGDPAVLNAKMSVNEMHQSPLHQAISHDRVDMAKLLVELGANVNVKSDLGITPLTLAAVRKNEVIVNLLLSNGAEIGLPAAVALGRNDLAKALVDANPDWLKSGGTYDSLITFFTQDQHPGGQCDLAAVALLLQLGTDVNAKEKCCGATALHYAAWRGNQELAKLLLDHGAAIDQTDDMYKASPVGWAEENHQSEMVHFFATSRT